MSQHVMSRDEVAALIARANRYLEELAACLETDAYTHLAVLEPEYASLVEELQAIAPQHVQRFSRELERLNVRLTELRDVMMSRRDAIRAQLTGAGQSAQAAKAYLKSTLVTPDKKS
jgi:hypothetical protein